MNIVKAPGQTVCGTCGKRISKGSDAVLRSASDILPFTFHHVSCSIGVSKD